MARFERALGPILLASALASCAAIGGLGDFKEVDCIGANCKLTDPDAGTDALGDAGTDGAVEDLEFVTIGGTLSGLAGKGLILKNNAADDLLVTKDGPFTFPAKLRSGDDYAVTIGSQPSEPSQLCSVAKGAGTTKGQNVTDIAVTCATSSFSIGGNVVGLTGNGLVLTNGGEDLPVPQSGPFTFANKVASGAAFAVTVKTQPSSGGPCSVSGGTGTVGVTNVNSIVVNCAPGTYTVGGSISGLSGTVVLQNNGGNNTSLSSNGTFAFTQTLTPGQPYAVTVLTQPGYPPRAQTCVVASGSGNMGSANVTNVSVTCTTNTYSIGGNVSGLSGTIVLKNNGGNDLTLNSSGPFTFSTPIASGNTYAVTIATPPSGQTCSLTAGSGTVTSAAITNVSISCSTATGDPGIKCAAAYCDPLTQVCCLNGGNYTCTEKNKCTGSAIKIPCDTANDCIISNNNPSHVCCGAFPGGNIASMYCTSVTMCQPPDAFFCDPNIPNPCPNGGTCAPTSVPTGFYRCF